ncbi:MAG: substrate-binding domain-containing protein [Pseudomonadota bacterium]
MAERVGLTKGTVSRALNGYPDISDRTRHRVARAAEEMGYRPLAHAQAIRTGRVRSIGLVLQVNEHDAHGPFLTEFLAGVTRAASAENWTLAVSTADSDRDMIETIERLVNERKADGFILPRTRSDDPRVTYLREHGVPFILFGRTRVPAGCAWFDILGEHAMRDAVVRLYRLGHRAIAFVNAGEEYNFTRLRHQGYLDGLAQVGLHPREEYVRGNVRKSEDGRRATESLLRLPVPPTGIVFATDEGALGAYNAARSLGLEIGRDVSVIAYDGIPEGKYAQPRLTTFSVDTRAAGASLASMLIQRIRGAAPEDLRQTAPAQLMVRGSDGAPRYGAEELGHRIAGNLNFRKQWEKHK